MSQEFEKKVLEKLDNFEGRFDRIEKTLEEHTGILNDHTKTLNEHTGILNDHTKTLNEHTGILNDHTKTLNEHTGILNDHTEILNKHSHQFEIVRKDIYKINNNIIKIGHNMEEIEKVVEYNTQTIKNFKEESVKKIDITFKACEQLNNRVRINECMISNLKSKNYENDVRISVLEDIINKKGLPA